jgi:uncharacterized protein YegP (UPF0339 family)
MMKFRIYQDQAKLFRWRLVANNGKILADSGEGYSSRGNSRRAATKLNIAIVNFGLLIPIEYQDDL